jgi:hypothetical protein
MRKHLQVFWTNYKTAEWLKPENKVAEDLWWLEASACPEARRHMADNGSDLPENNKHKLQHQITKLEQWIGLFYK